MIKLLTAFGFPAFMLTFIACNPAPEKLPSGENKLSPAIVDNPATASGKTDTSKAPEFSFEETTHHFGEVAEGQKVSFTFRFKNTGGSPLLVAQAVPSCGCTVPSYSKEPVAPGDKGEIKVTFDSNGKSGMVSKTITVIANTLPASKVLTISAEIIHPDKR